MNIFVIHRNPVVCSQEMCNKHVVKMIVESAQLLSSAFPVGVAPYKRTHINHPCSVWVRESMQNYAWLLEHFKALCTEYSLRYDNKIHKTQQYEDWFEHSEPPIPKGPMTPFARAIKQQWRPQTDHLEIHEAYRQFYILDKAGFARWEPRARQPAWWPYKDGEMIVKRMKKTVPF